MASDGSTVASADPVAPNSSQTCTRCDGAREITITVSTFGSAKPPTRATLPCVLCDGTGVMTPAQLATQQFHENAWCECPDNDEDVPVYHRDRQTPWVWCVTKHHWHCSTCTKLTQIG